MTTAREAVRPDTARIKRETLFAGLLLGVAADRLLGQGIMGPGLVLWVSLAAAAAVLLARRANRPWWKAVVWWSALAWVSTLVLLLRASPALQAGLLLILPLAAAMIFMRTWGARLGRSLPVDSIYALMLVPGRALAGSLTLLGAFQVPQRNSLRSIGGIGRGLLLAIPLLLVFIALFSSADAAFNRYVESVFNVFSPALPSHILLSVLYGLFAAGMLSAITVRNARNPLRHLKLPKVGAEETAVVMGLLAVLFVAFVLLQLRYLFGGRETIEAVSGLTLAGYARRGFFELLGTSALSLIVLLVGYTMTTSRTLFRSLAALLIVCVMVMLVSAVQRFVLYIGEFGLTLDRVYVLAIMFWIALTLIYFSATILRGRPFRFALASVLSGITIVFALASINPAALVARVNIERGAQPEIPLDAAYLISLGADAAPTLVTRLDEIAPVDRCYVASALLMQWSGEGHNIDYQPDSWLTWNAARATARRLVASEREALSAVAGGCH